MPSVSNVNLQPCQPHLFGSDEVTAAKGVQLGQRGGAGLPVHVRREQVLPRHWVPAGPSDSDCTAPGPQGKM